MIGPGDVVPTSAWGARPRLGLGLVALLLLVAAPALVRPESRAPVEAGTRSVAGSTCGPLRMQRVLGQKPSYLPVALSRFWSDDAVCRGRWLGGLDGQFVPQSIAVDPDHVWVSGYDGRSAVDGRICWIYQLERPSLRAVHVVKGLSGHLRDGTTITCHHAGGIAVDGPRLWVMDTTNLFLLRRSSFGSADQVRRVWRLGGEVRGSTGTFHPGKGLGLGRFTMAGGGRVDWYDADSILASSAETLQASNTVHTPNGLQGLAVGALRRGGTWGTWKVVTGRSCSVLVGPSARRMPVNPGVEGLAFDEKGGAWMLSESSVGAYYAPGYPVQPQVLRYSKARLAERAAFATGQRRADDCLASIDR